MEIFANINMATRGAKAAANSSQSSGSNSENEQTEDCRECKLKLRDSERALQCDFCDNMYCYKCTRVSAKSYDAICRSSQEEGI